MKPFNPNIREGKYKSGKVYWQVTATLPDGSGRYLKKHSEESEAEKDRMRLIREYGGGGIDANNLRLAEMAFHRLQTSENPDARGKDILTAVDWFVENYSAQEFELKVNEYCEDFIERKRKRRSEKTMKEIEFYMSQFLPIFGERKPSEISWQELERYVSVNSNTFHRYKVLNHFFGWLSNTAKDISKLEMPPILVNPFSYIERPKQVRGRPKICTLEEVISCLNNAMKLDCLPWFVWGFFTGMRPESEMKRFWKDPDIGWRHVDLVDNVIIVSDEIEKTRKRTREIKIQPNLLEWIKLFRSNPEKYPMYPKNLKRKFNWVKYGRKDKEGKWIIKPALPEEKASENDIMRHTFISNLSRIEQIGDVCYQCATSMGMIRRHYKVMISDLVKVRRFYELKPETISLSK